MNYTSKSLKVVLQLVLLVFALMFGISVLNLALTVTRHISQRNEVEVVKLSFDRMNYFSKIRVIIRSMVNMANEYEPMTSEFQPDLFNSSRRFAI